MESNDLERTAYDWSPRLWGFRRSVGSFAVRYMPMKMASFATGILRPFFVVQAGPCYRQLEQLECRVSTTSKRRRRRDQQGITEKRCLLVQHPPQSTEADLAWATRHWPMLQEEGGTIENDGGEDADRRKRSNLRIDMKLKP